MVRGQAEVNLGNDTVLMIPCWNDDGRCGLVFRSREPGDVTEKELDAAEQAVISGDVDVVLAFKSPESIDKLIDTLQSLKGYMESKMGELNYVS